jgi:hypothetical protein
MPRQRPRPFDKKWRLSQTVGHLTQAQATKIASVAELADAPDLGSGGETRAGSIPVTRNYFHSKALRES